MTHLTAGIFQVRRQLLIDETAGLAITGGMAEAASSYLLCGQFFSEPVDALERRAFFSEAGKGFEFFLMAGLACRRADISCYLLVLCRNRAGWPPCEQNAQSGPSRQLSKGSADRPWLKPPAIEALEKSRKVIPAQAGIQFFQSIGDPGLRGGGGFAAFCKSLNSIRKDGPLNAIHYIRKSDPEEICCPYASGTLNHLQESIQLSYGKQFSFHRSAASQKLRQVQEEPASATRPANSCLASRDGGREMRITSGRQRAAQSSGRSPEWRP